MWYVICAEYYILSPECIYIRFILYLNWFVLINFSVYLSAKAQEKSLPDMKTQIFNGKMTAKIGNAKRDKKAGTHKAKC